MSELWVLLSTAFMLGLMGSGHCIGMCGGIVVSINSMAGTSRQNGQNSAPKRFFEQIVFNSGRLCSYGIAGAIVAAALGAVTFSMGGHNLPMLFAALMTIAIGLSLTGWWHGMAQLERVGAVVWVRLQGLTKFLLPPKSLLQWFGLGALWGWLPCGLVYSALSYALVSGHWSTGFMVMIAFGLGTLPALLLAGSVAASVIEYLRTPKARRVLGGAVIIMGGWMLMMAAGGHKGHEDHQNHSNMQHDAMMEPGGVMHD